MENMGAMEKTSPASREVLSLALAAAFGGW